jgi:hypothetical protein
MTLKIMMIIIVMNCESQARVAKNFATAGNGRPPFGDTDAGQQGGWVASGYGR